LLIYTRCFTSFENIRQFACYCGLAPFEQTSGSSIKKKSGVSHLANKKHKSLLHLGALNLLRYNKEIQEFYERKQKEGKTHNCIMNIIKYKTISRVFAVIKRGSKFMDSTTFEAYKNAA
jgi:transposase